MHALGSPYSVILKGALNADKTSPILITSATSAAATSESPRTLRFAGTSKSSEPQVQLSSISDLTLARCSWGGSLSSPGPHG